MFKLNKEYLLSFIVLIACMSVFFISPIAQDVSYHSFVDQRTLFNIPYFADVVSNLPYALVGIIGCIACYQQKLHLMSRSIGSYYVFFIGLILIAVGSSYYHSQPNNETLLWDRGAMVLSFMAFFHIIIAERISIKYGSFLLSLFLLLGITSVLYWFFTETQGRGDLRFYGLIQFLPMILIPLILVIYRKKFTYDGLIWGVLIGYAMAKVCEIYDAEIFIALGGVMSGHTLKHLVSALGAACFLWALFIRKPYLHKEYDS